MAVLRSVVTDLVLRGGEHSVHLLRQLDGKAMSGFFYSAWFLRSLSLLHGTVVCFLLLPSHGPLDGRAGLLGHGHLDGSQLGLLRVILL